MRERGLHSTEFNDFCKQYPNCKIELYHTLVDELLKMPELQLV